VASNLLIAGAAVEGPCAAMFVVNSKPPRPNNTPLNPDATAKRNEEVFELIEGLSA
jgi:hypothetical protein